MKKYNDYNFEVSGEVTIISSNDEIMVNNENNDCITENGVSKIDTVDNSEKESRMRVEVDYGLLVSVDDLEREYRGSLNVEGEQGANFYGVKCEAETSQVLMEDKSSSCLLYTSRCV